MVLLDTIISVIFGLIMGLLWIIWKKRSLKATIIFFGIVWIFILALSYFMKQTASIPIISMMCASAMIGAVVGYFILKHKKVDKIQPNQKKKVR